MGLETRRGKQYYYKKRRVDGRVISFYVGGGIAGELAEAESKRRKLYTEQLREERAAFRVIESDLDAFEDDVRLIRDAYLIASGYHQHKGQWRKKRANKE